MSAAEKFPETTEQTSLTMDELDICLANSHSRYALILAQMPDVGLWLQRWLQSPLVQYSAYQDLDIDENDRRMDLIEVISLLWQNLPREGFQNLLTEQSYGLIADGINWLEMMQERQFDFDVEYLRTNVQAQVVCMMATSLRPTDPNGALEEAANILRLSDTDKQLVMEGIHGIVIYTNTIH